VIETTAQENVLEISQHLSVDAMVTKQLVKIPKKNQSAAVTSKSHSTESESKPSGSESE